MIQGTSHGGAIACLKCPIGSISPGKEATCLKCGAGYQPNEDCKPNKKSLLNTYRV